MKKIYLMFIGIGLFFQSCVMKEEMNVNSNEEFEFNYSINFSELLQSAGELKSVTKGADGFVGMINGKELSLEELLDLSLINEKNPEVKKDSIMKVDADFFETTKNIRLKATLNDSIGDITFKFKAKGVEELNKTISSLQKIEEKTAALNSSKQDNQMGSGPMFLDDAVFSFKKNTFERKVNVKTKKEEEPKEAGGMEGFFTYKIIVNFDKPIKKVSYEDAEISSDGKSFTKTFSLTELMENPALLEYKVELKQ